MRAFLASTFESLGLREYRMLWGGSLFATLAFMMTFTLQPVVAFDLAGTNRAVGIVQMGMGTAMLVVGPFGGVVADRVSKRPLVFVSQAVVAAAMLSTGILIIIGAISIPLLAATTAVMGLAFSFMGPARQAWVGDMVGLRLLPNAVAMSQLAMSVARVGAPLIAAAMLGIGLIGAGGAYVFMASLFSIVLSSTLLLPRTKARPPHLRRTVRTELVAGIQHVAQNPRLRLLMLFFIAMVVLGFTFQVVLPAMLERHLDRGASEVGLILTVNAIAGLVASLAMTRLVGGRWAWPLHFALPVVLGVGFLVLAAAPTFEVAVLSMLLLGSGQWSFMLVNNALLMASTAPEYYGRVMSLTMLGFGLQGFLAVGWGILADSIGERAMLTVVGITILVLTGVGVLVYQGVRRVAPIPVAAPAQSL